MSKITKRPKQRAKKKKVAKTYLKNWVRDWEKEEASMPNLEKPKRSQKRWTSEETIVVQKAAMVAKKYGRGIDISALRLNLPGRTISAIRNKVKEQALTCGYLKYYTYTTKVSIKKSLKTTSLISKLILRISNRFNLND